MTALKVKLLILDINHKDHSDPKHCRIYENDFMFKTDSKKEIDRLNYLESESLQQ